MSPRCALLPTGCVARPRTPPRRPSQAPGARAHRQHPAAAGHDAAVLASSRPGVPDEGARGQRARRAPRCDRPRAACRDTPAAAMTTASAAPARAGCGAHAREIAPRRGVEQLEPVAVVGRHEHRRLGIAEADVVLEHARDAPVDHQPHEEHAAEGGALGGHAAQRGLDDLAHHARVDLGRDDGRGRVGAHAAGVGAAVAVGDALVVLRGREGHGPRARRTRRGSSPPRRRGAPRARPWRRPRRARACARMRSMASHASSTVSGDDDPLARRQAVGLDDQRAPGRAHVALGRVGIVEDLEGRRGDAVTRAEALHERLGALEARGRAGRARTRARLRIERVDQAQRERQLRAHDDQIGALLDRERHEALHVVRAHGRVAARRPRCRRCPAP